MQEITKRSPLMVGLYAAIRSLVPLIPGFISRWLATSHWHMDEATSDSIGTAVGLLVKFVYSSVFAKSVVVVK